MKYTRYGMVILLPLAGWVIAADTGIEGSLSQSLAYDDNFLFRENADSTLIYSLTPQLTGYYRTPTYSSSLTGTVDMLRHSNFSEYDRSNPRLNWQQNWLRIRSAYSLGISYLETDQRSEAADDLGDFSTRNKVSTFSLVPNYQYQWSQRDTVSLSYNYTHSTYSGDTSSNDNYSYSLNSGWSHTLNQRLAIRANLGFTRFESEGQFQNNSQSDIWRINTGLDYEWSERTSLSFLIGLSHQRSEESVLLIPELNSKSSQMSTSVTLQWSHQSLLNDYTVSYTRDLVPGSDGQIRAQDRLNIGFTHAVDELSKISVNAIWLQSSDDEGSRDYFSVSPTYSRELSQDLTMFAQYDYKWQQRSNEDANIDGSVYRINLVYRF